MGQQVGKVELVDEAKPFSNLSTEAIQDCWDKFNEVAEGFGISINVFKAVTSVLVHEIAEGDEDQLNDYAEACFKGLDTDENDLIDALEFLATFALISAMNLDDKIKFMFDCYDFDESGMLTIDEMTLSLKSTITGLAKLAGVESPSEQDLEFISQSAFKSADLDSDSKISFEEFRIYCVEHPEVRSYLEFYNDPNEEWGDWDQSANTEVVRELQYALPSKRQMAADYGHDFAGLSKQEVTALFANAPETVKEKFTAVKPWIAEVNRPLTAPEELDFSLPDEALQMSWIYGMRTGDVRGCCRYTVDGDIVYPAASVGVLYNKAKHRQRFFMDHRQEIVSMAMHPQGDIVATGEVGVDPAIMVWDVRKMAKIVRLKSLFKGAVVLLSFSPDGKRLACIGNDEFHSLVVYDWESKKVIYNDQVGREKVLACEFIDNSRILTCGVDQVNFWLGHQEKNVYFRAAGLFGHRFKRQTMLCTAPVPAVAGKIVTGSVMGEIYVWDGRKVCASLEAHDGPVTTCFASSMGVLTGGTDSRVILWSTEMENLATFDMKAVVAKTCLETSIRSVCFSGDATRVMVAVSGGEAYEISIADGSDVNNGPVIYGHFSGEVHGLASHPQRPEFVTVGDDATIRVFDTELCKCIRMTNIKSSSRAVCYSPDGTKIALGVGTPNDSTDADGTFKILNEGTLQVMYQAKDAKAWISDIRWSPDGDTLAVASADGNIFLYNNDDYATKGKCGGRPESCVLRFDFSEDSQWVRSVCTDYQLFYHNAATGERNEAGNTELKSVDWSTQNVFVGWHVHGIWPGEDDGVDINASTLSAGICSNESPTLAVADSVGKLRLYNYPVPGGVEAEGPGGVVRQPLCLEYRAHNGPLSNVKFTLNDREIITTGATDRCIIQWKHETDDMEETADIKEEQVEMFEEIVPPVSLVDNFERQNQVDKSVDWISAMEEKTEEKEYFADQPWYDFIVAPSNPGEVSTTTPPVDISLEWVYGFRSNDCRRTAVYAKGNELTYVAGNVLVLYNQGEHKQRHGIGHPTDIVSLATSPDGDIIATGDVGDRPRIVLWDTRSLNKIRTTQGFHRNAVRLLNFSPDSTMLLSMGQDPAHTIAIWDVSSGDLRTFVRGGDKLVFDAKFSPDSQGFCTVGVQHIKFHEIRGRNVVTKKGIVGHEKNAELQTFLSLGYAAEFAVAGTPDGSLYRFDGRNLETVVREAHDGLINTIYSGEDRLITGGYDGKVKLWSSPDLDVVGEFNLITLGCFSPICQAVYLSYDKSMVLAATQGSEIFEILSKDGTNVHGAGKGPVVQGHCQDQLWGLDVNPANSKEFVTVGDDFTVRVWNRIERKQKRMVKLDCMSRSACYSPDGNYIAVGCGGDIPGRQAEGPVGGFKILQDEDLAVAAEGRDSRQWISDVRFSDDGKVLAVGSRDNKVYFYDPEDGYRLTNQFKKAVSPITHFDFSTDASFLRINDVDKNLYFCDVTTGLKIPAASELKDLEWSSTSCPFTWELQGVHNAYPDGTEIMSATISSNRKYAATVDSFGKLKLRNFPVQSSTYGAKVHRAHMAMGAKVRFLPGTNEDGSDVPDKTLLTVGGKDRCILQWKVQDADGDKDATAYDAKQTDGNVATEMMYPLDDPKAADEEEKVGEDAAPGEEEDPFSAVKPWVGSIVEPDQPPPHDVLKPDCEALLEHVYGYNSQSSRNNLFYTSNTEIVYPAATVGVIYNKSTHTQKFFRGHSGPIVSLAIDESRKYVATGESGSTPVVKLWSAGTGMEICTMPRVHMRAIPWVAFSSDRRLVCSVGVGKRNSKLAIYKDKEKDGEWSTGAELVASQEIDDNIICCCFVDHVPSSSVYDIFTGCKNSAYFWRISGGNMLFSVKANFGRAGKVQPQICAAVLGEALVSGTACGQIYVWEDSHVHKIVPAHRAMISAMQVVDRLKMVTGSRDGTIKVWDHTLECMRTFDAKQMAAGCLKPQIRGVCFNPKLSRIVFGTYSSDIYEICFDSGSCTKLSEAHFVGEAWGLAAHPKDPDVFATSSDDGTVRLWNARTRKCSGRANIDAKSRSLAWSPEGDLIGCGTGAEPKNQAEVDALDEEKAGAIVMLNPGTMEVVHEGRDSRYPLTDVLFSPDGKLFAATSLDTEVYMYDIANGFKLKAKGSRHESPVLHVDFTADSTWIRSTCRGYEIHYHNADTGEHNAGGAADLKDEEWATTHSPFGWGVQGIWDEAERNEVNATDASPSSSELLAVAESSGRVKIFKNPSVDKGSKYVECKLHGEKVTNVRFNADEKYLFTLGNDRVIGQWRLKKKY
jgi:WD40 repeat protein/Ca2+-binding EF-hand superfamily protein